MELAPSILSADFAELSKDIEKVISCNGADYLHIDVMDGVFVPNITFGAGVVKCLRKHFPDQPMDVHLMIDRPEHLIDDFIDAGADIITVHQESTTHLNRLISYIKQKGVKAGVSLNPSTPLCTLEYILDDVDMVLIMSVNPGYGGQKFIPSAIRKIKELKKMIDKRGIDVKIQVDGGIDKNNIADVAMAGADIAVVGSAIFNSGDIKSAVYQLRSACK